MRLAPLDWTILAGYLAVALIVGLVFSRRAGRSCDDFFVAGRRLPWWLAGMTMVASQFAIDTPLGITGLVAEHGVQGVWFAWAFMLGAVGTLGAFVFAPLLRRSETITVAELVELRYSGPEAAGLRVFKTFYFGLMINAITLGTVMKAVWTITEVVLGWDPLLTLAVILAVTLAYSTLAGMWGIAATDFLQFFVGLGGLLVLAYFALGHVGGVDGLVAGFLERYGDAEGRRRLQFLPRPGQPFFETFLVFVTLKFWRNPPPAIHQRMVSAKDERHAAGSTLVFAVVAFAVNYWPMILVAMTSLVVFPGLAQPEQGYPLLIVELIPPGLLGLLLAAMMAAFMSTVDSHLNSGAAFMVTDVYRRFVAPDAGERQLVRASRLSTVIMLLFSIAVAYHLESVQQAWFYLAMLTAGYGFLMVARWFWWRINAWSELAALAGSFGSSALMSPRFMTSIGHGEAIAGLSYGWRFLVVFTVSTVAWVVVTLLTRPCPEAHLVRFCRKVRPYPTFWGPIHARHPDLGWNPGFGRAALHWLVGSVGIFALCFGVGHLVFGAVARGLGLLALAVTAAGLVAATWKGVR